MTRKKALSLRKLKAIDKYCRTANACLDKCGAPKKRGPQSLPYT